MSGGGNFPVRKFLPTPSARRATLLCGILHVSLLISTHALREEGDRAPFILFACHRDFYPRPPRGGRHGQADGLQPGAKISTHALREEGDIRASVASISSVDFYPRPPRGGRPFDRPGRAHLAIISTHALREEGDLSDDDLKLQIVEISTHALREEGDAVQSICWRRRKDFYPRPPRGGRPPFPTRLTISTDFYPRPPRGGRQERAALRIYRQRISTHALREEGDSRPPLPPASPWISTHALREEGDLSAPYLVVL